MISQDWALPTSPPIRRKFRQAISQRRLKMNLSQRNGLQEVWKKHILNKLWSGFEQKPIYYTDLIFKCHDGDIEAHKIWLSKCCSVVGTALANVHNCLDQFVTILVPDFSIKVVKKFLQLFYTGVVELSSFEELELIKEFGCHQLGLSMSLDQLKFERVSVVAENSKRPIASHVFGSKKPSSTEKKRRKTSLPFMVPQNGAVTPRPHNFTTDIELGRLIPGTPSRLEQSKYKPKPKKYKPSFEQGLGDGQGQIDCVQIVDQETMTEKQVFHINQDMIDHEQNTEYDRKDTYNDGQDMDDDNQDMVSTVTYEEIDDIADEGLDEVDDQDEGSSKLVQESNGNQSKKISKYINLSKILPRKSSKISCTYCPKTFLKTNRLEKHLRTHKGLPAATKVEEADHVTGNDETNREDDITSGETKSENCDQCGKTYSNKSYLKIHMENVHSTEKLPCIVCNKPFKNKITLKFHMKEQHKLPNEVMIYT